MPNAQTTFILRIITVLWVIWGLIHAIAGVLTISQIAPNSISGIADNVDPAVFHEAYHAATDALINQHGFNLLWIGIFTTIGGILIWRGNVKWMFFTAIVGGATDVGYFVFMDLGGHVNFFPGTVMTIVSGAAVVLSLIAYFIGMRKKGPAET